MYTASFLQDPDFIRVLYIVAFICSSSACGC